MGNKKALLVIDMQKGSFTTQTPRFDTAGVVKRINDLAKLFRDLNYPVIFIQHNGSGSGHFEKNAPDWENLDELSIAPSDLCIDKCANDAFYNSELLSTLKGLDVSELFITGCATDFCVESTIQSALTKDFIITVVKDGHTTGDRPHLKAEQVIEHHNWIWQNMIPTKGQIRVETTEEIKGILL
ncbi:isochorismatase family protein [Algoriphagus chordae]|uniref:Nicotinamidase-related amidase n=1 Tax=Algoriphagus chordae TaxID=237019 RepID=A0A2W7QYL6_9BACT|nr:isochorismatase family protein [Algoriphagus chordae]PZX46859.1 nicotinamidase-related amidase [Algoriphagus chordae]